MDTKLEEPVMYNNMEEAAADLGEHGMFCVNQLQGVSNMVRSVAGATVFVVLILPTDNPKKSHMLSFHSGCTCDTCERRATETSRRLIEVTRNTSMEFGPAVELSHSLPGSEKLQ